MFYVTGNDDRKLLAGFAHPKSRLNTNNINHKESTGYAFSKQMDEIPYKTYIFYREITSMGL